MAAKTESSELRKGSVGLWHAVFLGFSHSAPAASAASLLIGTAIVAYGSMPLAMVVGVILYMLLGNANYWYAKKVASAGGYYSYMAQAISPKVSLYGSWFQAFYELYTYAMFGSLGFATVLYLYFPYISQVPYLWIPFFLIPQVVIFGLAYLGIRPSLAYVMYTGLAEAAFLIVASLIVIVQAGPNNTPVVFTLAPVGGSITALFFGVLFAADSMTGAISPVSLGEEIKDPKKNLPRAFFLSIGIAGITLIVVAYALTIGWGVNNMSTFGNYPNPGQIVFFKFLGPVGGYLLAIFTLNSYYSCGVAGCTDVSRMWYAMARDGIIFPKKFAATHPKFKTPGKILLFTFVLSALMALIPGILIGPLNTTISLAITSTLSWLVVKCLTNGGLHNFARKAFGKIHPVYHVIIPAIVIVLSLITAYSTFVPFPTPPLLYGAILFPVWAVIGIIVIEYSVRKHPEELKQAGKFTL